jgi:hypothetical protein
MDDVEVNAVEVNSVETAERLFQQPATPFRPRVLFFWPGNGVTRDEITRHMTEF